MIQMHVSAVLTVRDGFTGKPITQATVRCFLDAMAYKPEYRQGGYLVFVNITPGIHELLIKGVNYQDERITLQIGEGDRQERSVTLKPASNYPFGKAVTQLFGVAQQKGSSVVNREVWVAVKTVVDELKLAQDDATKGDSALKLFYRGGREENRFPGNYLIVDGKKSEVVAISAAQDGQVVMSAPLEYDHKRGVGLYPAQVYHTDEEGTFLASFREPIPVVVFDGLKKSISSIELEPGINRFALNV